MGAPANEPIQERILRDLKETLEEISTRHATLSFYNDVRNVTRGATGLDNTDPPNLTMVIDTNDTSDAYSSGTHGINDEELRLTVHGFVDVTSDQETWLQYLAYDVRTALMDDPRRAGLATHTHIGQAQYVSSEDAEGYSHVAIEVRVSYQTNVEDLTEVIS